MRTVPLALSIVAQAGGRPGNFVVWIVLAVMLLIPLAFAAMLARVFGLWMRAMTSGARIPLVEIVMMKFRKIDPTEIVRCKILGVQNGVDVPTQKLQSAYLAGADVERAVLSLARSKETGLDVTWEELLSADRDERLEEKR